MWASPVPAAIGEIASPRTKTPWGSVLLAIGAGMLAAFQVGKAHIALSSIRHSFSLSLTDASWVLSALSVVGLFVATLVGSLSAKEGTRRTLLAGLLIIAASSAAGAFAPSAGWLVWSRLFEGLGFVMVVVAAPSLIVEITRPEDIRLALAGWATYMPGGVALVTVLAPLLLAKHTWRALWLADAALLCIYCGLLLAGVQKRQVTSASQQAIHPLLELRAVSTARGPVLLAVIFGMYTMQHLGVMGFMPTVLIEIYKVSAGRAGVLVSIAMAANIIGNLAAGVLLTRGVRRSVLIGSASAFMALMTVGIFSAHLPLNAVYGCAFLFSCVGGLVPAAVMSAAPFHSPTEELIPATNGLLVQGSNLGIVLGPPLISILAAGAGWQWVPVLTILAAIIATVLAVIINRSVHSRRGSWMIDKIELSGR